MKSLSKFLLILSMPIFLLACNATSKELTPSAHPIPTAIITTLTPTPTKSPTITPEPTKTLLPTATITPWPTKEILFQYGIFGGDGIWYTDTYFGRDTPDLVLYTDGQLLIRESDDDGVWFAETKLSVPQMCAFLSELENTGFFEVKNNGSLGTDDPIYKFDNTAHFSEGLLTYIIQVNGNRHKQVNIYSDYVPYLIPEVRRALNLLYNYSPSTKLTQYQAEHMLLWIEKGLGDSIFLTPAPLSETWPAKTPPLETLAQNEIQTMVILDGEDAKRVSQVLLQRAHNKQVFEIFDNRITSQLFDTQNGKYFLIARQLLPHESPDNFSVIPEQDKEFDLPFECNN